MSEFFAQMLFHPFVWGLTVGLILAFILWRSSHQKRAELKRENKRLGDELTDLNKHLGQQLKITAQGNESVNAKVDELKEKNENLRVSLSSLQQKPGRGEIRLLNVYDRAIHTVLERTPGFAPAWEAALREAEDKVAESESGVTKLLRRVTRPSLSHSGD